MAAYTYDTKKLQVIIGGIPMEGFGDNKITVTRSNDVTTIMEGVDGDILFASSNKTSGTLSFDLIYGSDYDLFLDNLILTKQLIPIGFLDPNGNKLLATFGMLQSQADMALNETPDNRTWTFVIADTSLAAISGLFIAGVKYHTV